jgi:O-antigen ligase
LLGIASFFLLATEVLRWDLTITTGLSAKNLVIYMLAVFLALRMVMARTSVMAVGPMQGAFIIQIGYAIVTMLVAALVIEYQGYELVASGIKLKSQLIDYYIFFLVFLFGVHTVEDGIKVIKWILLGAVFANLGTVLDNAGVINLGFTERVDGRTQGAIGESNQYAAYIILLLPGLIAAAIGSRGARRFLWACGALVSVMALLGTASRGGLVGVVFACAVGAYLYRQVISYSRVVSWAFGALIVLVIGLSFSDYGGLLTERVIGQTGNIDVSEASSGRSEIWTNLIYAMFQSPITFITGFGWNVYWSMPFHYSPHNHYLSLWFNLGLVGLVSGSYLLFSPIARARRASLLADQPERGQLIAFVFGALAVCCAVFFVDLHTPWIYFWMYTGVVMRVVLCVQESPAAAAQEAERSQRGRAIQQDPYGWAGTRRRA